MNDNIFTNPENVIRDMISETPQSLNCIRAGKILEAVKNGDSIASVNVELVTGEMVNCLLFCLAAGGAFIDFTNFEGSDCIVLFNDTDLVKYKMSDKTLPSMDTRWHTLNNGIAISGLFPFTGRPVGQKHFVSHEDLSSILANWSEEVKSWMDNVVSSLKSALVPQSSAGMNPITFNSPLPGSVDSLDIGGSLIGGIVHND